MCDPLTIAGGVAAAGGAAANYSAQSDVASARAGVLAAERKRQQALQAEADTVNAGARDRYKDFGTQQDTKAASLGEMFKSEPGIGHNGGPPLMPASTSNITVNEGTKQNGKAQVFGDQQAVAQGKMRAFGDVLGTVSRAQARDAGTVGQIGNFEQGSSGVVPYELDVANHTADGTKFFGDLLSGAGKLGIAAGLGGGSLGGMFGATGQPMNILPPSVVASGAGAAPWPTKATAFNPFKIY